MFELSLSSEDGPEPDGMFLRLNRNRLKHQRGEEMLTVKQDLRREHASSSIRVSEAYSRFTADLQQIFTRRTCPSYPSTPEWWARGTACGHVTHFIRTW